MTFAQFLDNYCVQLDSFFYLYGNKVFYVGELVAIYELKKGEKQK